MDRKLDELKRPEIPDYVRAALRQVIEDLWNDALRDVRAILTDNSEAYVGDHVFTQLVHIRAWMDNLYLPPEMFVEDL